MKTCYWLVSYTSLCWLLWYYTYKQPECIDHRCGCSAYPLIAPGKPLAMVTTHNDHHCGNSCRRSNSWLVKLFTLRQKDERVRMKRGQEALSSAVIWDMHLCLVHRPSIHPAFHPHTLLSIIHFHCPFKGFIAFISTFSQFSQLPTCGPSPCFQ